MTIAEFFVEVGVKGTAKATSALNSIKSGLTDVSSSGLAAKAAIVGVVYAVERLTLGAAQMGTTFKQFENFTGISAQGLQRWQYALTQSGVVAEETQKNIENVQQTMGKLLLGEGQPKGYGILQSLVGFDITRAKDTLYVMGKLREYLKADSNITRANEVGQSFGLSPAVIQALRTTTVDLDKISKNQLISDSTIDRLNKTNIAWMNFWRTLKLFQANLVSDYGISAIKSLSNAFKVVVDTGVAVSKLTKDFTILKDVAIVAGAALAAYFAPVTATVSALILLLSEVQKYREGKGIFSEKGGVGKLFNEKGRSEYGDKIRDFMHGIFGAPPSLTPRPAAPDGSKLPEGSKTTSMNIKIDNHGVEGADQIEESFNTAVNFAFRQLQTVTQVA